MRGHHSTAELKAHLRKVGVGSTCKGRDAPRSRWMRLYFGRESAIRDMHGTPGVLRYPMLVEREPTGTACTLQTPAISHKSTGRASPLWYQPHAHQP